MNQLLFLAQDPKPQPGGFEFFIPILLMMAMVYFLAIRPQRKKQAQAQAQVESMKIGDKVVSAGGVHGLVTNIKKTTVMVKVADGVKIEFEKASIAQVIKKDGGGDNEPEAPAKDSK